MKMRGGLKYFKFFSLLCFWELVYLFLLERLMEQELKILFDVAFLNFSVWFGFYLFLLALEYGIKFLGVIKKK